MNLQDLRERAQRVADGLRYLTDLPQGEFTEERSSEFDWLEAEHRWLTDNINDLEAREARRNELREELREDANRGRNGTRVDAPQIIRKTEPFQGDDLRYVQPRELRDRAMAALDDEDRSPHLSDPAREQVERLLRKPRTQRFDPADLARRMLVTETDEYRSAYQRAVTSPTPTFTAEEARALRRYEDEVRGASLTDASGGYGVPVLIDPSIILTDQETENPFFAISRVEEVTTDEWKGVSAAGVAWSFDGEGTEVSDDMVTLAQPNVEIHSARGFIPYTIEIGGDYPGFAAEMARLLAAGYDEKLVEMFSTGSGSGQPFGIITALDANTNVEVTPTTDGAFGYEDVNKVWKSLPQKYRRRASWMMHVDVNNEVQSFGDDKLRAQTVNLAAAAVDQVKGRPVYESPYFPEFTGTTGASNILVVGDFSNYLIARRLGMTVELVPHLFATGNNRPNGQRGWFAHARIGADSINDLGFRLLQNQ